MTGVVARMQARSDSAGAGILADRAAHKDGQMITPDSSGGILDLRALCLAFLEALERGEPLSLWLSAYPEHAEILADLAATFPGERPAPDEVAITERIMRQTLQAHFHPAGSSVSVAHPLARRGLDFPSAATQLRIPIEILLKIDHQMIPIQSVPLRLLAQLGALLGCPAEQLWAELAPSHPVGAKPEDPTSRTRPGQLQTFAAAIQATTKISSADRSYWLAVLNEAGVRLPDPTAAREDA